MEFKIDHLSYNRLVLCKKADEFNFLEIELVAPFVGKKTQLDLFDEKNQVYGLDLDTNAMLVKSSYGWTFSIRLLGFGGIIRRQEGY